MPPKMDLTGKRFGKLVIIEDVGRDKKGNVLWKCTCDCGNLCEVAAYSLKNANTKSCGCSRIKDLTGKRFGRLVILRDTGKRDKKGGVKWWCKCDCGNYHEVSFKHLKSGETVSCGCFRNEVHKESVKKVIAYNREHELVENTFLSALTSKVYSSNTSGVKGVSWHKREGKWRAYITIKKKTINLGLFTKKEDAIVVRKEAEEKYHKPISEKYKRIM